MLLRAPWVDDVHRQPLLTAAGLVALLLVAGLGVGGFFMFRPAQHPPTAAQVAADTFLGRLRSGDLGGAYDQLCRRTREQIERDQFVARIGARPAVRAYRTAAAEPAEEGFTVRARVTDPSGASQVQVLRVIEDRGSWRVCGDAVRLPGDAP